MFYRRLRSYSKFCDRSCNILKCLAEFTSDVINLGFSFDGRYNYYYLLTVNGMFLFLHELYDSIRYIMCMCACLRICSFLLVKLGGVHFLIDSWYAVNFCKNYNLSDFITIVFFLLFLLVKLRICIFYLKKDIQRTTLTSLIFVWLGSLYFICLLIICLAFLLRIFKFCFCFLSSLKHNGRLIL